MSSPNLRKAAFFCAVIGAVALLMPSSVVAQVGMGTKDGSDFVEEQVSANRGVDSSNVPENRQFARANYAWPYASGPTYSDLEANLVPGTRGVVSTPVGVFRIGSGLPALPVELRKSIGASPSSGYYFLSLADGEATADGVASVIARGGGRVISFDPNSLVMVAKVAAESLSGLDASSGVLAMEPFQPALKLHPAIGRVPLMDPVRAVSEIYSLEVLLFPGEDANAVAAAISALGGDVRGVLAASDSPRINVDIHRSKLGQIAALEPVMIVFENTPWMLLAEETTTTMQTGGYNQGATPYHDAGIDGGGGGSAYGFCSTATSVGCTTVGGDSCGGGQGSCSTSTAQVLTIIDNGIQLDAGDLSNEQADSGWNSALSQVNAGHRKVLAYETTNQFDGAENGEGDLNGCDLPLNNGRTHGHIVASTAVGNATNVAASYNGPGWVATDQQEEFWAIDGVAPRGKLVAYDAQVTPGSGGCDQPINGYQSGSTLYPGELYITGGTTTDGSLEESYNVHGARSFNISFGKIGNSYDVYSIQIDQFLVDYRRAMVYVAAGNLGTDVVLAKDAGKPDKLTLQSPATAKNALAIGASRNADRVDEPESRAIFSSTGPAVNDTAVNRMAPHLMAPGDENGGGTLGMSSEFSCRSNDNDQDDPVECDISAANEGTSFSAPAAAGAGMLVRDYFAQGFYPGGSRDLSRAKPEISGSLVKAVLIASADFMTGANMVRDERFNHEQGYGRIQLDNVLPLETWPPSPAGMIAVDTLPVTGVVVNDFGGSIAGSMGTSGVDQSATFKVCDDKERLSVALTWIDPVDTDVPPTGRTLNNLDLILTAPSGIVYRGNYFTDDNNRNGNIAADAGAGWNGTEEDCPGIGGIGYDGVLQADQWSLPICDNSRIPGTAASAPVALNQGDRANTVEAIFLSPNADGFFEDTDGDGITDTPTYTSGTCTGGSGNAGAACGNHKDCASGSYVPCVATTGVGDCCEAGDLQTEPGIWTVKVSRGGVVLTQATAYSLVVSGGVCLGSSVRVNQPTYTCNDEIVITVTEETDALTAADIESRTKVQVLKPDGTVIDEEDLNSLIAVDFTLDTNNRFKSAKILISAGTAPDKGNGVLDVNDGDRIKVTYNDVEAGAVRTSIADVNCKVDLTVNAVLNAQYGQDSSVVFFGGCERNVRGKFELAGVGGFGGFPDRYLDAGEFIQVDFIAQSDELSELDAVNVSLSCVEVDANSPATCLPDGTNCLDNVNCVGVCDPRRADNKSCDGTIDPGTSQTLGTQYMTIVDPDKTIGLLPGLSTIGTRFSIQMASDAAGQPFDGQPTPTVELLIALSDPTSGKSTSGIGVNRIKLNVDANVVEYSTDFPMGGTDILMSDLNENEVLENPVYEPGPGFQGLDYRFETRSFGNLLVGKNAAGATVNRNQNLRSPWNFDGSNGGFSSGLGATTDEGQVANAIYNWGEDENFNNVEDGWCRGDRSIPCYRIGAAGSADIRCLHLPGTNKACDTIEDRAADGSGSTNFNSNWSTEGGCGWQTKPPATCTGNTDRGCFTNSDCLGTCIATTNTINSTFASCVDTAACGATWSCNSSSPIPLRNDTCGKCSVSGTLCRDATNSGSQALDCPTGEVCNLDSTKCAPGGTCVSTSQECDKPAGNCTGPAGKGGVWHTGIVNKVVAVNSADATCFGSEKTKDCQSFGFISGTASGYEWWNFLLTPVMEKVNQEEDPLTGDPLAHIEITNWAWNHAIDLPDNNVQHTWEMDTDIAKLLPVDLTSDDTVLNSGNGKWGAVSGGSNPELEQGWGLFAPMGTCGVKNCGGLGTPSSGGTRCEIVQDCGFGGCSRGSCNGGKCSNSDPPHLTDDFICLNTNDCLNFPGQNSTITACNKPAPGSKNCVTKADCDTALTVPAGTCAATTGCDCEDLGANCHTDGDCAAQFGAGSECTNPDPEGCKQITFAGNSESPCSADEECVTGVCTPPAPATGQPCHFDSDCDTLATGSLCGNGSTSARAELCFTKTTSVNGDTGPSRVGQNSCYFQGPKQISDQARTELGLAKPIDNDQDDDLLGKVCSADTSKTCTSTADCKFKGVTTGTCIAGTADGVDEYVTANGPKRNFDLTDQPWNGPDMRFFTLEDIYGDTGNTFQGALGFINTQGGLGFPAKPGFGEAIDDMVVEWREFTLESDQTDCAAGSCATVIIDTDRSFKGEGVVNFRVMDQSPYANSCSTAGTVCYPANPDRAPCPGVETCVATKNDCTGCATGSSVCLGAYNSKFNDAEDDDDCNNNGKRDVIVLLKTEAEPIGERVVADEISPGSGVFQGSIVVSSLGNSAGTLFAAQIGADNPTITTLYADDDDGTGNICENAIVPEQQGFAVDQSTIFLSSTCNVAIAGFSFFDNGDVDDYPDTNETATVTLNLLNLCGFPLNNCLMRISSNSPSVDCILNPVVPIAHLDCAGPSPCLLPPQTSVAAPPFQWRVSSATQSTNPNAPPLANFAMTLTCDEIAGLTIPQSFSQGLDLNIVYDTNDNSSWGEDFEGSAGASLGAGGTQFEAQNNDVGIPGTNLAQGLINGDGYRCQYSDPDWPNAGSSGDDVATNCFPAFNLAQANEVFWRIDGDGLSENKVDDGRAKQGTRSLYYGLYDQTPETADVTDPFIFTTPQSTIEAAGNIDPVNLGVSPTPILSWWQEVSLMDGRRVNIPTTRSSDRGVVALQLADTDDTPIGDWIKLVPFKNTYDTQAFSNFFNCQFDPIDDGNDEDDFFDPTDPNRRLGPSSTCFGSLPGGTTDFTFTCIGDTDGEFDTTETCNGEDGSVTSGDTPDYPPIGGSPETGTWMQSRIDLTSYKGRRVRFRYMVTGTKVSNETWELNFKNNPDPTDDGWWIDDIQVDHTLTVPAVFTLDNAANATLPACGTACTSLTAKVTVVSEQPTCSSPAPAGTPCGNDAACAAYSGSTCVRVVNPGTVVLDAPGQVVELNGLGGGNTSEANACHSGSLQFRFKVNGSEVRTWTEDATWIAAPTTTTTYTVDVRCSTLTSCTDSETVIAQVDCPSTGNLARFPLVSAEVISGNLWFEWDPLVPATDRNVAIPGPFQVYSGSLASVSSYAGSVVAANQTGTAYDTGAVAGADRYYLFARDGSTAGLGCNETPFSWSSGGSGELPGRDSTLPPP